MVGADEYTELWRPHLDILLGKIFADQLLGIKNTNLEFASCLVRRKN